MDKKKNVTQLLMKELPPEQRPYEKAMTQGLDTLSDAELLAVILRSGTSGKSAVDLCREILQLCPVSEGLAGIHRLPVSQLTSLSGIGPVKALQIKAVGELSKRLSRTQARVRLEFSSPDTIADYYMETLRHEEQEHLLCMLLDTKNHLLGEKEIFKGTVNASLVSPREIFLYALENRAVHIILVHNHPSGDPAPSKDDILITNKILKAGELLDIHLLDHIIIGDRCFVSLKEQDYL